MAPLPSVAPVLSTPDTQILNETVPVAKVARNEELSDEQLRIRYEIDRTTAQIRKERWSRVALQFPDEMLPDSTRVYQLLSRGLPTGSTTAPNTFPPSKDVADQPGGEQLSRRASTLQLEDRDFFVKLTILADTSYGSCCVDEIAAEHVGADAVIHYGRACLSPTARLPVVHVFTERSLDHSSVIASFKRTFPDLTTKIILTADVSYASHVDLIWAGLCRQGYTSIHAASILHEPSSPLPNRTIPDSVRAEPSSLLEFTLFHISEPPTSLLLTLSSRVRGIHIYPTSPTSSNASPDPLRASTSSLLRRRYALVTSLSTVPIWGILINTLSVKNYLEIVEVVKKHIASAGKKSYLFVVGKLNAAKLANFSEIGGWVVIGCWESSLIDSKDFYRPVVTPFELMLALQSDSERLWTGQWRGDFQAILDVADGAAGLAEDGVDASQEDTINENSSAEEESAPPEFDLRTGKYVSQTRPFAAKHLFQQPQIPNTASTALAKRATGDVVSVSGVASPGAEYLRSKRTWQGLGSDLEIKYEEEEQGVAVEEGRSGIARGYTTQQHTRKFNVTALQEVIAKLTRSQFVSGSVLLEKIAEGASNKVFLATVGRQRLLVKVPDPVVQSHLVTASEVATLEFLRTELGLPVPKVLAWNDDSDNPVGCEYIVMEEALGQALNTVWPSLEINEKFAVVDEILLVQKRLVAAGRQFKGYGSLYFAEDAAKFDFRQQLPVSGTQSKFCLGPLAHQHFLEPALPASGVDCGPWHTANGYLTSIAQSSMVQIRNRAGNDKKAIISRPFSFPTNTASNTTAAALLDMLEILCLTIPFIVRDSVDTPLLWHKDLHFGNMFVSPAGRITSIIDWQDADVLPLFLGARVPQFIEVQQKAILLELPENFSEIPEPVRLEAWERYRQSMLQQYYLAALKESMPEIAAELEDKQRAPVRKQAALFARISDSYDADALLLRDTLLRIQRHWPDLVRDHDDALQCPIKIVGDDLRKHQQDGRRYNEFQDRLNANKIAVSEEGWVHTDEFEEQKGSLRNVIKETTESLRDHQARQEFIEKLVLWDLTD